MKRFSHWSPIYILNRAAELVYRRAHPTEPWLTRNATEVLAKLLRPTDVGLEFGSGRSTIWFATRIGHLTSIEHDSVWYSRITDLLKDERISNVAYEFREVKSEKNTGADSSYVEVAAGFSDNSLDFVLVDGAYRDLCVMASIPKLKPGGLLVIDNVNWFLPSTSISPNSRSLNEGPKTDSWIEVYKVISNWRVLWTTSGVTDTAIYFKPCISS
jgi:predicted O-methyltransferase YrrM